jgi:formylglycine-generating enzyme required for sulfatase activity
VIRSWQIALGFAFVGCSQSTRPPNPDEIPESVVVPGSDMTEGYAIGILRRPVALDTFRITRFPITVGRWKQCISAGACKEPASVATACTDTTRTFQAGNESAPITCVTPEQAESYCAWQRGWTPSAAEWLLAARGPTIRRYPWGDSAPDCTQHPGGVTGSIPVTACRPADQPERDGWVVGKHPSGASPSGMQDILLTPAELLARTAGAQFPACFGERGACLVRGIAPAAIDAVGGVPVDAPSPEIPVYAFRCAWVGGNP